MGIKIQDLQQELNLSDSELSRYMGLAGVRIDEGVKRLQDKDAYRIKGLVRDSRRREVKKKELVRLPSIVSVRDFALKIELPVTEIIKQLLKNGVAATVNEDLDYETAAIIAQDLGYQTEENVTELEQDVLTPEKLAEILTKEDVEHQVSRPPVVTIMGHVDHGKTTLLDTIREANVAAGEAGGITQKISSYQAKKKGKLITFIDTPGHEAFEFMRKRGASLADVAILVVAADDGIKEQTKEAIRHAKAVDVPIIVAITKMDKPGADAEKVKRQLSELELVPEEYGGKTPVVPVSAVKGTGLDDLLDTILLVAEINEPKAIVNRAALATVIESRRDSSVGVLTTVLIHAGTLHMGDNIVVGKTAGKVRRIISYDGRSLKEALPSMPVTIVGIQDLPDAGDILQAVEEQAEAREKAARVRTVKQITRQSVSTPIVKKPVESRYSGNRNEQPKEEPKDLVKKLNIVLKADTQGSLEAIKQTVQAMGNDEVKTQILSANVGNITENDIMTAEPAKAIIFGFNVNTATAAVRMADNGKVTIKSFKIIYELAEEVRQRLEDLLPPIIVREDLGKVAVVKVFFSVRGRQIVGGRVVNGIAKKKELVQIMRGDLLIATGKITELQQNKNEAETVKAGQECGITFEGNGKAKEGDSLMVYHEEVQKRKLGSGRNKAD
ncbi:MAG: translation initiation factor IF-2 [bacterium]|nr:translation initiation factor IF-2 [bacterium]